MPKPFDFINSLNAEHDLSAEEGIAGYNPWLTNKHFGMHLDTIMYANEINGCHRLDHQLQHDFYLYTVRRRKRFAKWHKSDDKDIVSAVSQWFGINNTRAREVLRILPESDVEDIRRRTLHDGTDRSDRSDAG